MLKAHHGPLPTQQDVLPISTQGNNPMIVPITILDSKWDNSTSPPTEMDLVQWLGLAPKDTTWEDWNELRLNYHLEDKVTFPRSSSDNNPGPTIETNPIKRPNEESDPNMTSRIRRLPKYLAHYNL